MEDIKKTLAKVIKFEDDTKKGEVSTVKVIDTTNKDIPVVTVKPFRL